MSENDPCGPSACCESGQACVFAKALLARAAVCELAARRSIGERELVECSSVVARTHCATLAALMHAISQAQSVPKLCVEVPMRP